MGGILTGIGQIQQLTTNTTGDPYVLQDIYSRQLAFMPTPRTPRQQLEDQKAMWEAQLKAATEKLAEVEEALKVLDEHPMVDKVLTALNRLGIRL